MSSSRKPPGDIHKIREFELEKVRLADEFDILQIVGEGWFGKILLVEHRATDTEMVLKALPKPYVSLRDFYREFHYGLHLGVHRNIVTTYDVAFETAGFYVFTQEYAPLGDLTSNMSDTGIGELHSKRVAKQIASALDYMHTKDIVHRDVKLDNVLIYRSDFSKVKLCDFGESFEAGTVVERRNEWLPYSPPEVLQVEPEGTYKADPSHDVWQFGIVIFVCLTGCLPWQKAASDDPRYIRYLAWQATNMVLPLRKTPKLFKLLSSRGCRMFRRFLEPRQDRRPKNLSDLSKFLDDRWLAKGAEKDMAENEQDVLCPSMYSFHSSPEEKNKLLSTLAEHGIETTVDRATKKNRIKDWIESSVIMEDDEEDESGTATPSSTVSREPVPGHISSIRAEEARNEIKTTLKDASNKHFDPRTGALQHGPSEMGTINRHRSLAEIPMIKNGTVDSGSVITLASRNDVILSEGQSFHSQLNLDTVGVIYPEPMVNARLNVLLNNTNESSTSKPYNESVDLNFPNNVTNNQNMKKQQQAYKRHYSSSALNINNNYSNSNLNKVHESLAATFQSLATISVPEASQQLHNNTQIKDNGYGSNEKIKLENAKQMPSRTITQLQNQEINRSESINNSQKLIQKPRSPTVKNIRKNVEMSRTMKDTPYDRIKVKRGK